MRLRAAAAAEEEEEEERGESGERERERERGERERERESQAGAPPTARLGERHAEEGRARPRNEVNRLFLPQQFLLPFSFVFTLPSSLWSTIKKWRQKTL